MDKVYVITTGENFCDYKIKAIFLNREVAKKYYAAHYIQYMDGEEADLKIEEWDISDDSEIKCNKIYKAIFFSMDEYKEVLYEYEMKYSKEPFVLDICRNRHEYEWYIDGISGYIPVDKNIDDWKVAEKIIFDHVAKWKAEQAEL